MPTNEQKIANLRARTLQTIVKLQFEPIYGKNWWTGTLLPHMEKEAEAETVSGKKYRVVLRKTENLSIDDLDTTVLITILLYDEAFKGNMGGITAHTDEYDLLLKISNLRNAANHDETGHESLYAKQSLELLKNAISLFELNVWEPDLANEIETFTFNDDSSDNILSVIEEQQRMEEQKALGPFAERYNQACIAIKDGDYTQAETILIKLAEAHIMPACKKLAGMYLRIPEFCNLTKAHEILSVLPEQDRTVEGFYYLENLFEKEKIATAGDISTCWDLYNECIEGDFIYSPPLGQHYLSIAAENGDSNAMLRMSTVATDRKTRRSWLTRAAEAGNVEALLTLGFVSLMSVASDGISDEDKCRYCGEALKWYEQAEALGSIEATRQIGTIYSSTDSGYFDKEKAQKQMQKAADYGDTYAMDRLSRMVDDKETAFFWCQKAAMGGEATAMDNLSRMFYYGSGCQQDLDQAFYWAKSAVEAKCVKALAWLGSFYRDGVGCDKDDELAYDYFYQGAVAGDAESMFCVAPYYDDEPESMFWWYKEAAKKGHKGALTNLGMCYRLGCGCPVDPDSAFRCWKEAAKDPSEYTAIHNLASCYESGIGCTRDVNAAFSNYSLVAEKCPASMNDLGRCYEFGIGCNKDLIKAFTCYKKAAEQAELAGIMNLRRCYQNGIGCEKDKSAWTEWTFKAAEAGEIECIRYCMANDTDKLKWITLQANSGDASAMNALGNAYLYGDETYGVEQNYDAAFRWFNAAKERGYIEASYYLSICYSEGYGCTQDTEKSFNLLSEYVSADDPEPFAETLKPIAIGMMGDYFWYGIGCAIDKNQAFTFYQRAAELNNPFSIYKLGVCYASGEGCEFDAKKAAILFKKAAEAGRIEAMEGLAWCYFNYGTKADERKAYYWYGKAAEAGNQNAQEWIAEHPEAKRYYDTHKENPESNAQRSQFGKFLWGEEKSLTDE